MMKSIEAITPETKIGALLEQFPQLEPVLLELSPAFKKLQNPILRKTIAKIATLRQVAQIGEISLASLINRLRQEVGLTGEMDVATEAPAGSGAPPAWFDRAKVIQTLDARPLLEAGEHPMTQVMNELKQLQAGEIYELITPFVPAPLLELAQKNGYLTWYQLEATEVIHSYFAVTN
jgi:uncharacterized protein (DUF2249 family)